MLLISTQYGLLNINKNYKKCVFITVSKSGPKQSKNQTKCGKSWLKQNSFSFLSPQCVFVLGCVCKNVWRPQWFCDLLWRFVMWILRHREILADILSLWMRSYVVNLQTRAGTTSFCHNTISQYRGVHRICVVLLIQ